jgi:hypothetical protein
MAVIKLVRLVSRRELWIGVLIGEMMWLVILAIWAINTGRLS